MLRIVDPDFPFSAQTRELIAQEEISRALYARAVWRRNLEERGLELCSRLPVSDWQRRERELEELSLEAERRLEDWLWDTLIAQEAIDDEIPPSDESPVPLPSSAQEL